MSYPESTPTHSAHVGASCLEGDHGPIALGNQSHERSLRTDSVERVCGHCGAKWRG